MCNCGKKIDCKQDHCGKCCGNKNGCMSHNDYQLDNDDIKFLIDLLSKYYLPFIQVVSDDKIDNIENIIYLDDDIDNDEIIKKNKEMLKKLNSYNFINIDYNIALDEYSYTHYHNIEKSTTNIKRGSLEVSDTCLNTFFLRD